MKVSFATDIIRALCGRMGARLVVEPEFGFVGRIEFANGKRTFFRGGNLGANPDASSDLAKDKTFCAHFLRTFGYPVPDGQTFFSDDFCKQYGLTRDIHAGYRFARTLGFPVILKPNDLSQGVLVGKVHDRREFYHLAKRIMQRSPVMRAEQFCCGRDYRLVVLDGAIVCAYEPRALSVTGDGRLTVEELVAARAAEMAGRGRSAFVSVNDPRTETILRRAGIDSRTVLPPGEEFKLLDNANMSTGGEAVDVSASIHPKFKDIATSVCRDMSLRYCGVDLLTEDATRESSEYVIIELNAAPGLGHFASLGPAQARVVEETYLRILRSIEQQGP